MAEVTIGGNTYRTGKLTPLQQFHLARRLLPMLTEAGDLIDLLADENTPLPDMLKASGPFVKSLASKTDEEVEAIVNACLVVVNRKVGDVWAQVMPRKGQLMFEDLALMDMMQLIWTVVEENLLNFSIGRAVDLASRPALRSVLSS